MVFHNPNRHTNIWIFALLIIQAAVMLNVLLSRLIYVETSILNFAHVYTRSDNQIIILHRFKSEDRHVRVD